MNIILARAKRVALLRTIDKNWDSTTPQSINGAARTGQGRGSQAVLPQAKDVSTNMLEGLCKLSAMTSGQSAFAYKLLVEIMKRRAGVTGTPSSLQARDIAVAIRVIQRYVAFKRTALGRQQMQQAAGTSLAPGAAAAPIGGVQSQPVAGRSATSLIEPGGAARNEQALAIRILCRLWTTRRALLDSNTQRQSANVKQSV